jgi:hypothetical protein
VDPVTPARSGLGDKRTRSSIAYRAGKATGYVIVAAFAVVLVTLAAALVTLIARLAGW